MTLTDFLIIYLACGAPFGVYYFFTHRHQKLNWLKSIIVAAIWICFAFRLLQKNIPRENYDYEKEVRLEKIKKKFEGVFSAGQFNFSLFEFRETFDRYVGLTLANQIKSECPTEKEFQLSAISREKNNNLTTKCLNRRNRKLLFFHQTLARKDFLQTADLFLASTSNKENLGNLLLECVTLLEDAEAQTAVEKIIASSAQSEKVFAVNNAERDLWKNETPKQSHTNPKPVQLQTLTAANSTAKD